MGVVLVLMGASGSGKSTLAKALATATGAPVVSYDQHQRPRPGDDGVQAVSAQALASAWRELAACCACGGVVIVDGTHCQRSRRVTVRAIAAAHHLPTVVIALTPPLEVCLRRQGQRGRRVPAADVARQHAAVLAALPVLAQEGHAAVLFASARERSSRP
ncbi:ATP-binding protein [Nonomuraea endophytica]|uniref:Putative kinase n=1 Tax=Nonomuraea endophytica TaxID=714136 RepID=A0A7W8A935_9ACTN|nr:ATP-binding protein [Nonomuraea endophytica]MBB5081884.1 putative kinase [Nonomuraea endophytica]